MVMYTIIMPDISLGLNNESNYFFKITMLLVKKTSDFKEFKNYSVGFWWPLQRRKDKALALIDANFMGLRGH